MQNSVSLSTTARSPGRVEPPTPWWRFGMVWLVVGGPAAVVVASAVTFGIAARHADPVVVDPPPASSTATADARVGLATTPTAPALQGRNHAATPRP